MRGLVLGVVLIVLGVAAVAQAASPGDAVNGVWLTADGSSRVQIAATQGVYDGRVVWLKNPDGADGKPKVDRRNPDASLRTRPVMGLAVLSGFHYAGNNVWDGGTIYSPETGKSYACQLSLAPDGSLKLKVGGAVFGRTITWTRAASAGGT